MSVLGFDYEQVKDEMTYKEYKDYEQLIEGIYEKAEIERREKWRNFVNNGGLKTKIKKCFINGMVDEKTYNFDDDIAITIRDLTISNMQKYDRHKRSDNELRGLGLSEEEINSIHEERIRKAISAVRNNIYRRINERDFYFAVTFTSNKKYIYKNPKLLLRLAKKYLKSQDIEGILVLEPFQNEDKGWHIHCFTNKPVNFDEWYRSYGANEDNFEKEKENFEQDCAYYEGKNLYCKPIRNKDKYYSYTIKKINLSYRKMKELYPNDSKVKLFEAIGTSTPRGSHIGNYILDFEHSLIFNSSIYDYFKKIKSKYEYNFNNAIEEENCENASSMLYSWLYGNLDLFLPLFDNFQKGLKEKRRWSYLSNSEKELFKFLKNDLINIAKGYIELQQLDREEYGFKSECYQYYCYITEKLAYKNRERIIRYKEKNSFDNTEKWVIYRKKAIPFFENFIYEEFEEIITWAYEEAEKRVEDEINFEKFIFVQKQLEEEKQYKKDLQIRKILEDVQGIINYFNILHFVAIRKENKKENRDRVYIIKRIYKAVIYNFMLRFIGRLKIN